MGKKISLIIDDWLYNDAIKKRPEKVSESSRIRELITKGFHIEKLKPQAKTEKGQRHAQSQL